MYPEQLVLLPDIGQDKPYREQKKPCLGVGGSTVRHIQGKSDCLLQSQLMSGLRLDHLHLEEEPPMTAAISTSDTT